MRRGRAGLRAALAAGAIALAGGGAVAGVAALPASAAATAGAFSGQCQFSGPITPSPPITVAPKSGSRFSFDGTGTCTGTLDGTAVTATPDTLTFTNASTLFDTCEFGPDVGLSGEMIVGTPPDRATFAITIDLARLALAGPFEIVTGGGGEGVGTATFTPPSTTGAVTDCAASGIATATLAGSFNTVTPLVGVATPATSTATTTAPATSPVTTPGATRRCLAVSQVVVRLHPSAGQRVVQAVIYLDGRRIERVRGHRLTAFRLRRLTGGKHIVTLATRTSRGRVQTILRRYDICA